MSNGPRWCKLHVGHKHLFDALPDEIVGRAIKYTLANLDTGEEPEMLDTLTQAAYNMMKISIREASMRYDVAVESGRNGAAARKEKENERLAQRNSGQTSYSQARKIDKEYNNLW